MMEILDDPATDVICYGRAYNCMRELAKNSILAPSVLINNFNLKLEPDRPVHGEAFAVRAYFGHLLYCHC